MKEKIIQFLTEEIDKQTMPGAVIRVKHNGDWFLQEAVGHTSTGVDRVEMSMDHLFDVASLTKVVATLPSILKLLETGNMYLNDRVAYFLPEFGKNGKADVTIRQLLTHSSGLIAHRPYFERRLSYEDVLKEIFDDQLVYKPDTEVIYSDLGFIVLGEIVKAVTGVRLDDFARQAIFEPLGMKNTGFMPKVNRSLIAPTEYVEHIGGHKYGIVHDDNTEFMGGISGHAGLFSTASDLSVFCDMLENDGYYEGKEILNPAWLRKSRENFTPFSEEVRGIGWQLKGNGPSPAGDLMSEFAYGHTGFTGTSFYLDPLHEVTVILLTNRVYFGRHDRMNRMRPRLHNLILSQLLK
ncbi:serine hydrolase domain-containing protein [Chungangia koreensis]|uniref:Serine hydrolase domain-containing protein n=1 Tax=Chungangia koreensis TaxID=752657 RepID=A0ABV8X431_9LACT